MPPDQDVEFTIELQSSTAPIYRWPNRMTPKELVELKIQLKNCWTKGISIHVLHLGAVQHCL
jgi:hypothetical protein